MKILTEIKPAIARSISHNEIVIVEVDNPRSALEGIDNDEDVSDLGWSESEIGLGKVIDIWGKRLGKEFRIQILTDRAQ